MIDFSQAFSIGANYKLIQPNMENLMTLHEEFVKLGRMRYKLKNRMLYILPKIYESGIYKKYATSIYEYAAKFGDISRSAVTERLRLEPNLENKPHLKEVMRDIGVKKVAMIAKLATSETEEIFAEKLKNMSKAAVQTLSKELRGKEKTLFDNDSCHAIPEKIKIELDEEMTFLFLKLKKKIGENKSNKEIMTTILQKITEAEFRTQKPKITNQKTLPGQGLTRTTRYIPVTKRREELDHTNGKCAYPNCNHPAEVFHHQVRFAKSESHESIKPLCKKHHEFAHNGLILNEQENPDNWKINIAKNMNPTDQLYAKYRQNAVR